MPTESDWGRVNWDSFDEALNRIRDHAVKAQETVADWTKTEAFTSSEGNIPLYTAMSELSSAVVGLWTLVQLHHHHVAELEKKP